MDMNSKILQCGYTFSFQENNLNCNASWIGPDNDINQLALSSRIGTDFNGCSILSGMSQNFYKTTGKVLDCKTTKLTDDRTRLDLNVRFSKRRSSSVSEHLLKETWSETMTQYSFPLYRYCAPSCEVSSTPTWETNYGDAVKLKSWENTELSGKMDYQYRYDNTPSYDTLRLEGRTKEIATKILGGCEEVLRFYPNAQRTSIWDQFMDNSSSEMQSRASKLNHIDNTPHEQFPWSISWLKTGFDWTQNTDETWTLVETWQGVQGSSDGVSAGWDPNLYGDSPDRWEFWYKKEH